MTALLFSVLAALLLTLRSAKASAALTGSQLDADGSIILSCIGSSTCADIESLAFEGYITAPVVTVGQPRATCLCTDGTRIVTEGPAASAAILSSEADGPLLPTAAGCFANMTWSLAAPFVRACGEGVPTGVCSTACANNLAPYNQACFQSVLRHPFFQLEAATQLPSPEQAAALYDDCFPALAVPATAVAPPSVPNESVSQNPGSRDAAGQSSAASVLPGVSWALTLLLAAAAAGLAAL